MRSLKTEGFLKREGAEFKYIKSLSREDILVDENTRLAIRQTLGVDEAYVRELVTSLEIGDEFPAVVVVPHPKISGKFILITGLHRLEAYARMDYPVVDAYVVDTTDPIVVDRLRRSINRIEGKRTSQEEALRHGLVLVNRDGYSISDAARSIRVPVSTLQHHVTAEKVSARLVGAGSNPAGFSMGDLVNLNVVTRDPHLKEIADLAREARLSRDDIKALVNEVEEALKVSDAAANDVLANWKKDLKDEKAKAGAGKYVPSSPFRSMRQYLEKSSRALDDIQSVREAVVAAGDVEVQKTITRLREVARKCNEYAKELEEILHREEIGVA